MVIVVKKIFVFSVVKKTLRTSASQRSKKSSCFFVFSVFRKNFASLCFKKHL